MIILLHTMLLNSMEASNLQVLGGIDCILRNATPEEIQELDDQLAAEGKRWNPDTMQIEKLRWKPIKDVRYFHIIITGGTIQVDNYKWAGDVVDENLYDIDNCFKTKKEAEVKLE